MTTLHAALLGALGGAIPEALRIIKDQYNPKLPAYLRSPTFYIGLVLSVALGALVAVALKPGDWWTAVVYGFAAPEILTRVAGKAPAKAAAAAAAAAPASRTMREWWAV